MGRGQNLVGGILIGTRLAMRPAGHFAPFSDRSRCHRRREPTARDGRGCIISLQAVAQPPHHLPIVLTPPQPGTPTTTGMHRIPLICTPHFSHVPRPTTLYPTISALRLF